VASIWKQENQVKYAKQIAKMAADLYDKFVLFLTDFSKIGERIKQSQDVYEQAFDKLSRGKGNIVSRINKFKEYGIHNSKNISDKFISDETDE
jgi:DNA recombination protein RmuC